MAKPTSTRCRTFPGKVERNADDGSILRGIANGDLSGFDTFVDRYKGRLMGYIRQRIGDAHEAEDVVQEVFLKVFRAADAGGYIGSGSATAWLFTIANNSVRDYLRYRRRRPLALAGDLGREKDGEDVIDNSSSNLPGPVEEVVSTETDSQTGAILARLPDPQREVVILRVFGELSFREIAEVTGTATGTVKSRMRYALVKIKDSLFPPQGD